MCQYALHIKVQSQKTETRLYIFVTKKKIQKKINADEQVTSSCFQAVDLSGGSDGPPALKTPVTGM